MTDVFSDASTAIDRDAIRAIQARYRNDVDDALKAGRDIEKLTQQQHQETLVYIATLSEADAAAFKSIYIEEALAYKPGPTPTQIAAQQAAEALRKKTDARVKRGIVVVIVWIAIAAYWLSR